MGEDIFFSGWLGELVEILRWVLAAGGTTGLMFGHSQWKFVLRNGGGLGARRGCFMMGCHRNGDSFARCGAVGSWLT